MDDILESILNYLQVESHESVLLIGDETSHELIDGLYTRLDSNVRKYDLRGFDRPLQEIPADLGDLAVQCDLCFYALDKKSDETHDELSFRKGLAGLVEDNGGRVGNMLSVTPEILQSAFSADASKLRDMTESICDYMRSVSAVHVTSPGGTDVTFEFGDYNWIASTGFIKRKTARNIMPAEVYTHPASVNGDIVIDGSYALLISDVRFTNPVECTKNNPLYWKVRDGIVVDVLCKNKQVENAVVETMDQYENARRIGEYGMGTNIGIKRMLGHVGHDEKFPTVHVANGRGYPKETGAVYDCNIHHDGLVLDARVQNLDDGMIILDKGMYAGKFL
ncbi:MAG: aminopeptidase [Candidatus Woesearchaeota archaeon]